MQKQATHRPLLTIAIPTYNRAAYLRELLSSLFDQLVNEPRVELIVFDNASPDDTPLAVADFQQRGLSIRSRRNAENIGADANFLSCFEEAAGRYVWIFGDDDVVVPGGVGAVLSVLEAADYDLVHIGSYPIQERPAAAVRLPLQVRRFGSCRAVRQACAHLLHLYKRQHRQQGADSGGQF